MSGGGHEVTVTASDEVAPIEVLTVTLIETGTAFVRPDTTTERVAPTSEAADAVIVAPAAGTGVQTPVGCSISIDLEVMGAPPSAGSVHVSVAWRSPGVDVRSTTVPGLIAAVRLIVEVSCSIGACPASPPYSTTYEARVVLANPSLHRPVLALNIPKLELLVVTPGPQSLGSLRTTGVTPLAEAWIQALN
ncbi:unannotated protein [freshwater metagenome]|uniref:Unannotated protein n=1 Tax=freshwater metagenome TaxID=449393 RepID=A0A6J7JR94_9ZZZZ